jgi:histone deacetylase complex regulatory component SIN3
MEERKNEKWKESSVDKRVEDIRLFVGKLGSKLQEAKYEEFLTIMKAYKDMHIDTDTVISRLQEILKGNRTLITEINRILP